jgi:hypothetical protein
MSDTPIGYIVFHEGGMHTTVAIDVFVRKGVHLDPSILSEYDLYDMEECEVARAFAKEHPDYEYIGSEDLAHAWEGNVANILLIHTLLSKGFAPVIYSGQEKFEMLGGEQD